MCVRKVKEKKKIAFVVWHENPSGLLAMNGQPQI